MAVACRLVKAGRGFLPFPVVRNEQRGFEPLQPFRSANLTDNKKEPPRIGQAAFAFHVL